MQSITTPAKRRGRFLRIILCWRLIGTRNIGETPRLVLVMSRDGLRSWPLSTTLIRREFHLFLLLSGHRPDAIKKARVEHLDFRSRVLHVPKPKGGETKAFDIPLSRSMIRCLLRVIRIGRALYPEQAEDWLFPADSESGHLAEHKEKREELSKWGNDLRQSFRTVAQAAGVPELDVHLLMNHSIPGVNAGYITRNKLLRDHLRTQQETISRKIFDAARPDRKGEEHSPRIWPALRSREVVTGLLVPAA